MPRWELNRWTIRRTLLRGATGTTQGIWVRFDGYWHFSVTIGGVFTIGSVDVLHTPYDRVIPTDATWPVLFTRTDPGIDSFRMPVMWLLAKTTGVDGPVDVDVRGVRDA